MVKAPCLVTPLSRQHDVKMWTRGGDVYFHQTIATFETFIYAGCLFVRMQSAGKRSLVCDSNTPTTPDSCGAGPQACLIDQRWFTSHVLSKTVIRKVRLACIWWVLRNEFSLIAWVVEHIPPTSYSTIFISLFTSYCLPLIRTLPRFAPT